MQRFGGRGGVSKLVSLNLLKIKLKVAQRSQVHREGQGQEGQNNKRKTVRFI